MNEPTIMYQLKPVFEIPHKLDIPSGMYKMKNPVACVTKPGDHMDDKQEVLTGIMDKVKEIMKKPVPELASLEARWDTALQQLSSLKVELEEVKKSAAESGYTGCDISLNSLKIFQRAVINANPSNPPYFLLLVKHLCKSSMPISISTHVHSSVLSLSDSIKCFNEQLSESDDALKLVLIWKDDILDTELVINPQKQLPIRGEVNILRLLARSGLKQLKYPAEELLNTIQIDAALDLCHRLLHVKAAKEKASLFKNLNAKLGRSSYFGGEEMNIVDVSAWSALKQTNVNPAKDLTPSMAKWYAKMDQLLF